jgi:putative membrane protein
LKIAARLAFLSGLGVLIMLVVHSGGQNLLRELAAAGWLLLLLVPLHFLPLLLDVCGWRALVPGPARLRVLLAIAAVREAINRLLPVAAIGGEFIGVRLLMRHGTPGGTAAASVIVETMLTVVSQSLFAAIGVMCVASLTRLPAPVSFWLGLALGLPVLGAVAALIGSRSIIVRLERLASRLCALAAPGAAQIGLTAFLDESIRRLVRSPGRLMKAVAWQVSGLLAGCLETWLVLRWLGHPVGFAAAVALESLTQIIRSLLFIVPAGVGVQELGLIGLSRLLGVDADTALALSLAKRLREALFGLPVLALWQWSEEGLGFRAAGEDQRHAADDQRRGNQGLERDDLIGGEIAQSHGDQGIDIGVARHAGHRHAPQQPDVGGIRDERTEHDQVEESQACSQREMRKGMHFSKPGR